MKKSSQNTENGAGSASRVRWAFDTETENGKAILLTVAGPDEAVGLSVLPKTFEACFDWLAGIAEKFVAFNMDYDARALLKFLPKRIWRLLYRDETATWTAGRVFWSVTYKDGKEFIVKRRDGRGRWSRIMIYDIYAQFQSSLAVAAEKTLGRPAKKSIPKSWYLCMKRCLLDRRQKRILDYAVDDAKAARDLWTSLEGQYRKMGVPEKSLARPVSPGSIAAGFFGRKLRFDNIDVDDNLIARRAYAGGRIEVFRRGYFPNVYGYDLKSAYPWALSTLPDPRDLDVVHDPCLRADAQYTVAECDIEIPVDVNIPPVPAWHPLEDKLRIFPCGRFRGWYTLPEINLLDRNGWLKNLRHAVHLCGAKSPWLTEIPELFAERKKHPEYSQAVKLVLNSIYGKLAQMHGKYSETRTVDSSARYMSGKFVRSQEKPASTTNFFVAAYVTALCRLKLWSTAMERGARPILFATDGMLLDRGLPCKSAPGLGDWEETMRGGEAVVIGTGVYSVRPPGEDWKDKARGFRLTKPLTSILRKSRRSVIRMTHQVAYTLGDFVMHGAEMNKIVEIPRTLDLNFDRKRRWPADIMCGHELMINRQSSEPLILL